MASIGELFIELGVKADTETLKNVGNSIKGLRTNLLLVGAAFTGAIVGLDRFVNSSLKGVVALQNLNQQTGLSIEKLQQFQQAGQLSNLALNADQIAQSIGNVQRSLAEISLGGGNLAPFQLLGISPLGKDAFQVIEELRGAIQGVNPAMASNLISQMGLSPEFINILRLSREEFDKLSQNTFLDKNQRKDIDSLGTSITALKLSLKALKDQAVAKLAPELNELVQKFFKWIKDNGEKIVKTIASLARGFAAFANAVGNAFALTGRFLENIIGLENGIKILAVAFAALSLSFSPFLLGLAAVILLLDDIAVYKSGGDSLIGDLINSFKDLPDLAKILMGAGGALALGGVIKNIGLLGGALRGLAGLATILSPITAFFTAAIAFVAMSPKIGKSIAEKMDKTTTGQAIGDFLLDAKIGIGKILEYGGNNSPLLAGGSSQMSTIINNNNNNINISGVPEPQAVGREVGNALENAQAKQGTNLR